MYNDALCAVSNAAGKKSEYFRTNPVGYMVSAMLAGAYVGVGVFLAFIVGGPLAEAHSPWLKIVMGGSFTIALALVIFAGGELFTGNNMAMVIGCCRRKTSVRQLATIWTMSWVGNLIGALLLAVLLYYSSSLNANPEMALVQKFAEKKMHLSITEMLCRGMLCNWLVCLAVWCTYRMKSEVGKLTMIFWCLYAFVASGFEHSVANMTLLSLALLQPHGAGVSLHGMANNLLWVTIGNILGGGVFVGAAYLAASGRGAGDERVALVIDADEYRNAGIGQG